jgi:endonuclease YncB( thermonuclease family)
MYIKMKVVILIIVCSFFGFLVNEQNTLIKVPKDERNLAEVPSKIISGNVTYVDDGDSFVLNKDTKIRLFGIDAPELSQTCLITNDKTANKDTSGNNSNEVLTNKDIFDNAGDRVLVDINNEEIRCGEDAKNKLAELVKNHKISCSVKGKDTYARLVSECYFEVSNKKLNKLYRVNINKEMVISGNAVAFLQFSDKYLDDENKARRENRGIWATTFDLPSVYRKKNAR